MWQQLFAQISNGDIKALARAISLFENEVAGYEKLLKLLPVSSTPVIGITGPPGAGKSTLTDALIQQLVGLNKKVAVLCVDPSSPFNLGALLGDRIRMSEWYNSPNVFIRSLATRGSLGGLHPKIIEITDLIKIAGFDFIIVETVGVGQSEIEIAGLADTTMVVLVPEGGDEIQTMKAGLMEIADIFVVNKADRPGADMFIKNLHMMLAPAFSNHETAIPIIKTIATEKNGITDLYNAMIKTVNEKNNSDKKYYLLAEKAYQLIQQKRMQGINKKDLYNQLKDQHITNVYRFVSSL